MPTKSHAYFLWGREKMVPKLLVSSFSFILKFVLSLNCIDKFEIGLVCSVQTNEQIMEVCL